MNASLRRFLRGGMRVGRRAFGALPSQDPRRLGLLPLVSLSRPKLRNANMARIRRLCMAVRVSDDTVLCRALGRYKMYVAAEDYGLAAHLMLDGFWEIWVTEIVPSLVREGMVAVDVGANQGYYTLLLADLVGPRGRVHAIEPNERMVSLLRRSVIVNGFEEQVDVHAVPLGARTGERVTLRVPAGQPSGAFLTTGPGDGHALSTATLDEVLGSGRVDFVKIDAEGSEWAIWQGMRGILARGSALTVLIEFVRTRSPDPAAFLDEMRQYGFTLQHVDRTRGLLPVSAEAIQAAPEDQEWILVLRRDDTGPWSRQ